MVKQNLVKKKRGRPKGSKNKRKVLEPHIKGPNFERIQEAVRHIKESHRYKLKSRIEKDALDADQTYYFLYDLNSGDKYPEIIARFTVETEAELCTEFLNGIRKITKRKYEEKRVYIL